MNFDTKHLVRWGIPGWIMIMSLGPYTVFAFDIFASDFVVKNSVAIGAFLTVIGVPLGYLLNQIHHSLFWVLPRRESLRNIKRIRRNRESWNSYFLKELHTDELFFSDEVGNKKKERYQYLLSRKHELGGVTVSLGLSSIIIGAINFLNDTHDLWSWIYFSVVTILCLIMWNSRNYSSLNIDIYFRHYLQESNELRDKPKKSEEPNSQDES